MTLPPMRALGKTREQGKKNTEMGLGGKKRREENRSRRKNDDDKRTVEGKKKGGKQELSEDRGIDAVLLSGSFIHLVSLHGSEDAFRRSPRIFIFIFISTLSCRPIFH